MANLLYKGIVFDEYTQDDDGVWAEMCEKCAKKYKEKLQNELDDGGTACGCCSVKGCTNNGRGNKKHYYIDFDPQKISYITGGVLNDPRTQPHLQYELPRRLASNDCAGVTR